MEERGKSIMLLGYRFSTGNSIVKRALKAMTVVICVSYTLVTGNANRMPGQSLCCAHVAPTAPQREQGALLRGERSPTIWVSTGWPQYVSLSCSWRCFSRKHHFPGPLFLVVWKYMCAAVHKGCADLWLSLRIQIKTWPSFVNFLWNIFCLPNQ